MTTSKEAEEDMVTAEEAAAIKRVTRQAVYAAIRDGRLPSRQTGRGKIHLILRSDLDAWKVISNPPKQRRKKLE
jgi:excisionase family DNA binding protein